MKHHDLITIGAGISGLSLAHYAAKAGLSALVIEKSKHPGGCLHTWRKPDTGFWVELGAHTCYNSYSGLIGILEQCGGLELLRARENVPFRMLVDGKIKSIPSQMNFPELLLSLPRIFTTNKAGMTVGEYYSRIIGQGNFKQVLSPALNAVPSQDATNFPADMLFKKRQRRKDVIRKFTLEGGLQTIAETIVKNTSGMEVLTNVQAMAITQTPGGFEVALSDGSVHECQALALAVPPDAAASLLEAEFPRVSKALTGIKTVAVESTAVVLKKDKTAVLPVAGIIPRHDVFYSAVSRDIVPDEKYRGFCFHFKPGHFKPGIGDNMKLKRMAEVLGTDVAAFEDVMSKSAVLPSPAQGHRRIVEEIDSLISGKRLLIAGNYFTGLAIEDCVQRSALEFQRLRAML